MFEGNVADKVQLKKSQIAVKHTIMGQSVDQLATEYGLSKSVMRDAMFEMGILKHRGEPRVATATEEEKSKYALAGEKYNLTEDVVKEIITMCGHKISEGRKKTNTRKYEIIDDTAEVLAINN